MNKVIICPFYMQHSLLSLERKEDCFVNAKAISKEELLNYKFGHYTSKTICYVMNKENTSYENARILLKYARYVLKDYEDAKLHHLFELRNDLVAKGLLVLNPYYKNLFKDKKVEVYGYSKFDHELMLCLEGIDANFHVNPPRNCVGTYENHASLDNEVFYMLNNIASLIDQEFDINSIYIYTDDELVIDYISKHHKSFGFEVNFDQGSCVYTTEIASNFLKEFKENKDVEKAIELVKNYSSNIIDAFIELVRKNTFDELNSEQQYDYYKNIFKVNFVTPIKYDKAVRIISNPIVQKDAHVFVPCFVQGKYPSVYKDNQYLNDSNLALLGLNTSLDNGMVLEDVMTSFFFNKDMNFYFSSSSNSFKEVFYESPWVKKLNLLKVDAKLPNALYSFDLGAFLYGKGCDLKRLYRELTTELLSLEDEDLLDDYMGYENEVDELSVFDSNSSLRHSYSALKNYFECPFKYYLYKVLKLDPFEGSFNSEKGNVAHKVLEKVFTNEFDFEKEFETQMNERTWTNKEKMFMEIFKKQLKIAVDVVKQHSTNFMSENKEVFVEKHLEASIEPKAMITGNIDKIFLINNKYLFVIDYKSGPEKFVPAEVEFGYSLQLPTYVYLLKNSPEFSDFTVAGLYINSLVDKSLKTTIKENELIPAFLKLSGITIDDKEIAKEFDTTIADGSAKFIGSYALNKSGGFNMRSSKIATEQELEAFGEKVGALFMDANFKIKSNSFEIAPKFLNAHNPCKYCPFKDICYVTNDQKVYLGDVDEEEKEDEE